VKGGSGDGSDQVTEWLRANHQPTFFVFSFALFVPIAIGIAVHFCGFVFTTEAQRRRRSGEVVKRWNGEQVMWRSG